MGVREPAELKVVTGVKVVAGVNTGVEKVVPERGSIDEVGVTCAEAAAQRKMKARERRESMVAMTIGR